MGKRGKFLAVAGAFVAVVLVAGGLLWYLVIRSDAPAEVTLADALGSLGSTPAAQGGASADGGAGVPATLAGTWVPATSGETFVGYRVQEELARVGANTAVGRTSAVSGQVVIEDTTVSSVTIEADLTGLKSDNGMRDNQLRRQAIETSRFPKATFQLAEPIDLPESFAAGETFSGALEGKLTLHGVTRDVSIPVEARLQGGHLVVVGSLDVRFSDYSIAKPSGASVLSIEDKGTMEFQLVFQQG
jgi:polyisoprenoid-binding protein YceI